MLTCRISVADQSAVGEARRDVRALAAAAALPDADGDRATLVASEIASNLAKHAVEGEMIARALHAEGRHGIEMLGVDRGPGIRDPATCLRDGYSTAGSSGTGLGAIRRLATAFDLWSLAGSGTIVLAQVWDTPAAPTPGGVVVGAVCTPYPGETACGDGWAMAPRTHGCLVAVVDGVGHGPIAADAATGALAILTARPAATPRDLLDDVHRALRGTRGAAMSVAELDLDAGVVRFAGIGNVAGAIVGPGRHRAMVSHHGTLGHQVRVVQEFSYPWGADDLLLLSSDGLQTRWSIDRYPGLALRHPSVIAALLHRDFRRDRDDATVVVVRAHA
ncbi:MAG TPA: ATP-binding protein [Candidatus Binatia bacterium]|jgi:anti-sigma regulatory factor (Ser/Thr protein kinase)|nr:ATP-binding protein [Candidatus Binatia bacterium]